MDSLSRGHFASAMIERSNDFEITMMTQKLNQLFPRGLFWLSSHPAGKKKPHLKLPTA